ncbi:MAG: 3-hydroxyacyl-CoA dehydrogenase [Deltaproteobacteria bacterium]|nr:3-hydroxyacyl-CoA dehydrogenase [Deltaproteobacteria bacterium]
MKSEDIKKVLIIGAGTMGRQIGFVCAISGLDVTMYDIGDKMLESAEAGIAEIAKTFVDAGRLTREQANAVLRRMSYTTDAVRAGSDVDFVSESVPEDPGLKGRVFAQFNEICPERAVFTTNTSTLIPSMIAQKTGRPDRFAAFHFHDVRFTNIVDIMPHPETSEETLKLIKEFAKRIGQNAILLKKENFGYVFNAMLSELLKSAQTLAANGVSPVEDIDRAWMGVMHTISGPFGIMDSIGIDTVWKITDYWAKQLNDVQAMANAAFLKNYVDRGDLGVKTCKGFYTYPDPAFSRTGFVEGK